MPFGILRAQFIWPGLDTYFKSWIIHYKCLFLFTNRSLTKTNTDEHFSHVCSSAKESHVTVFHIPCLCDVTVSDTRPQQKYSHRHTRITILGAQLLPWFWLMLSSTLSKRGGPMTIPKGSLNAASLFWIIRDFRPTDMSHAVPCSFEARGLSLWTLRQLGHSGIWPQAGELIPAKTAS